MKFTQTPACAMALALSLLTIGNALVAQTDKPAVATQEKGSVSMSSDGMAVKGYDVVAYFEDKRPQKGDPSITYKHEDATYAFVSDAHREMFKKDPSAYMPQYGGYCAFGTSKGHKAEIDPQAWAVVDGKLYLNSSRGAQRAFDKDQRNAIKEADANWPKLKQ